MALPNLNRMTEAEYLAFERAAGTKHEYRQGEVVAMVGGTREHSLISLNLAAELRGRLRNAPCETHNGDMRVRVKPTRLYAYPDVVVVCGQAEYGETVRDMLLNPTLIAEVLSPSTESYDRGRKFWDYSALPSLREVLLVWQTEPRIEQFFRQPGGLWSLRQVESLDATLDLASVPCTVPLRDMYARITWPSGDAEPTVG